MTNSGGPWGGGGNDNEPPRRPEPDRPKSGGRGGETDIDRILSEGQAQLRKIVGGRGNRGGGSNDGGSNGGGRAGNNGPKPGLVILAVVLIFAAYAVFQSLYRLQENQRGLVLRFGQHVTTWDRPGLNFALWPIYKVEKVNVTELNTERVGSGNNEINNFESSDAVAVDYSLMLTSDENIVDIEFDVVWRIKDPASYQFNLEGQRRTIVAVAQSSIREVVAQLPLIPILNTERENINLKVKEQIQRNLDRYNAGIEIVRVNLTRADPPSSANPDLDVVSAFQQVQAAEATRDRLQNEGQATANELLGRARGQRARLLEEAEAYRAQQINDAEGEASRFSAVLEEYRNAPDVTRRRLYLETLEEIYRGTDKIFLDENENGSGVVPYLPLNELNRRGNAAPTTSTGVTNQ